MMVNMIEVIIGAISAGGVLFGVWKYFDNNKRNQATYIENHRPIISIISSNNFYKDLTRNFHNKVLFNDRKTAVELIKTQSQNSCAMSFKGFGIFNMGGGNLRNIKILMESEEQTVRLSFPILKDGNCLFVIPNFFKLMLNGRDDINFKRNVTVDVFGITDASEKIYINFKVQLLPKLDMHIKEKEVWNIDKRENKFLNRNDYNVTYSGYPRADKLQKAVSEGKYSGEFENTFYELKGFFPVNE